MKMMDESERKVGGKRCTTWHIAGAKTKHLGGSDGLWWGEDNIGV